MDTRTSCSKSNATNAASHIEEVLNNYTIANFLLTEKDLMDLIRIQDKCKSVPIEQS